MYAKKFACMVTHQLLCVDLCVRVRDCLSEQHQVLAYVCIYIYMKTSKMFILKPPQKILLLLCSIRQA